MKIATHLFRAATLVAVIALATTFSAAPASAADDIAKPKKVAIPVTFKAEADGFVSLGLYDAQGVIVRSLAYALPVTAGEHQIQWDGTTDMGLPSSPGEFKVKGVFFSESPKARFVMKVGKDGNPPYRTSDGTGDWGANLGGPCAICANSDSIVMAWSCVEDGQITGIQQTDSDGHIKMRYFSFYPWDGRSAGAMDEKNLYLGILNGEKKRLEIAEYQLGNPRGRILTVLPNHFDPSQGRLWAAVDGIAINKTTIYATDASENALYIIDRASGDIRRQVTLNAPSGVVISGDKLLVVSDKQLLQLTLDGDDAGVFVKPGTLDSPYALAADGNRNIYASGGIGQVCVFAKDGSLVRRIGKPGGTPSSGRFDAAGIGSVTAMCIGPDQKLWIQDTATGFQRTSRWSPEGKLEQQWFNHTLSLWSELINPGKLDELVGLAGPFADNPGISAYAVDLNTGTWKPSWHYDLPMDDMYMEDVFRSFAHGGNPYNGRRGSDTRWPVFTYDARQVVIGPNGLKYFINGSQNGEGAMFVYDADHKPRPVALVGFHQANRDPATGKIEDFYQGKTGNWFTWADRDGDGKMSTQEIIFTEKPEVMAGVHYVREARLDADLSVLLTMAAYGADGQFQLVRRRLTPQEILPNGAVIYDWSKAEDAGVWSVPNLHGGDGTKHISDISVQAVRQTDDAYYCLLFPNTDAKLNLSGIDGPGWWASRNWRTKLAKFDKKTGQCMWAVGKRAPNVAKPGEMYHPAYVAGVAGGAVFVTDTLGPVWVWTTDGLFLGHIYNDHVDGLVDANSLYGEIQATEVYTDAKTGKIYSVANDTAASIHEVLLPRTQSFTAAPIMLTDAQAAAVVAWDPEGIAPTDRPNWQVLYTPKPPDINNRMYSDPAWFPPESDKRHQRQLIQFDGGTVASMNGKYDDNNLYIACEVWGGVPPINSGSELPYAPFVSGAYVDFIFGPHWEGPRSQVMDGDVRIILARVKDGDNWTFFQQGYWQIKSDGKSPYTIQSPAAKVRFDQIAPFPGIQFRYMFDEANKPQVFKLNTNYIVQVAIPLASLGIDNPSGKTIGFDASVAIPNAAGDRRERVAHWAGRSEAAVVDRPGSAELLPETWGSITFVPR